MPWGEAKVWSQGDLTANFYQNLLKDAAERPARDAERKKIIKPREMPWEDSPHGRLKHLVNEQMNTRAETIDLYMQIIPAGSRSGKHRHMAEECIYILEGEGYDLHWDCDLDIDDKGMRWVAQAEPKRFAWKAGDVVYIPPMTVHQHFNSQPGKQVRLISATNRIYKWCGLNDLTQLENAPEYKGEA